MSKEKAQLIEDILGCTGLILGFVFLLFLPAFN